MMGLYSSGALGGVEVLEGGLGGELAAHVLQHHQHQIQQHQQHQIQHQHALAQPQITDLQQIQKPSPPSGRSSPGGAGAAGAGGAASPSPSKLFVGGLSWQTSCEKLREYFAMFGAVTDVLIMKDPVTQRSRGFGFITFQEAGAVDKVLAVPVHTLDGKRIDPKHATPKSAPRPNKTKKIFVGGVGQDTSADEVRAYFSQFGGVEDAVMLMDQQTKRHRGFGFVTFLQEDAVERVCDIHFHTIKNKKVECKRAQPKEAVGAGAGGALALGKRLVVRSRPLVYGPQYRYAPYSLPALPAAPPPLPASLPASLPPLPAYSLAPLDCAAFPALDWQAMYQLPMYL